MNQKADLCALWVAYAQLDRSAESEAKRDAYTEEAFYLFEAWSFSRLEARILASLFLKPRSFGHLQWDVGFDAGDQKQADRVQRALDQLIADGFLLAGEEPRLSEHWLTVFLVLDPHDSARLRSVLGVSTPAEVLVLLNPLVNRVT